MVVFALTVAAMVAISSVPVIMPGDGVKMGGIVEIGDKNVVLAGAGRLDFEPDAARLAALLKPTGPTKLLTVLTFNHDGMLLGCTPDGEQDQAAGIELCLQMRERARFNVMKGFDLPFSQGQLSVGTWVEPASRPLMPLRLLPSGQGKKFELLVGMSSPSDCWVMEPPVTRADNDGICNFWNSSGRTGGEGYRREIWLAVDEKGPPHFRAFSNDGMGVAKAEVRYLAPLPPQEVYLAPADGRLAVSVAADDYPTYALRYSIEGRVRMLVGVNNQGQIVTCRPLESSGTPQLDNDTCALFLRRARVDFVQPQSFEGVRYKEASITWKLP